MTIAAKISPVELRGIVNDRFVGEYFEALLINAPGVTYTPGVTDDNIFLSAEVVQGTGGYSRQIIGYTESDVQNYNDDGIPLSRKATVFPHDGSATPIEFTHCALIRGGGNVDTLDSVSVSPASGSDGTYTNLPTTTDGDGYGATLDVTIASDVFTATITDRGFEYSVGDTLTVTEAVLVSVGAVSAGAGDLEVVVSTSSGGTNAGDVVAVASLSAPANLNGGNEAAFYWDLKQWGFYNS